MAIGDAWAEGSFADSSFALAAWFKLSGEVAPTFNGNIANQSGDDDDTVSLDVSGEWLNSPTSYAVTSGSLPSGLTISNAGLISGTMDTVQALTGIAITGTNSAGFAESNTFTWDVISSAIPPAFTGSIANQTNTHNDVISLDISGQWSNTPTSYVVTSGSLPAGVTVSNAGLISGTASTVQALTGIVITASNGGGSAASDAFTWDVEYPALAYSVNLVASSVRDITARALFTAIGTNPISYGVAILADGAGAPSAADVLAGTVAGAISSLTGTASNGVQVLSSALTGLTAETAYDMYVSIDDSVASPILSTKVDFTTRKTSIGGGVVRVPTRSPVVSPIFSASH